MLRPDQNKVRLTSAVPAGTGRHNGLAEQPVLSETHRKSSEMQSLKRDIPALSIVGLHVQQRQDQQ